MKKIFAVILTALILTAAASTVLALPALYDTPYIGNRYRRTFHYRECASVDQMNPENQVPLQTREEALQKNFRPCKNCNP